MIIGVIGARTSGKTTFSRQLVLEHGYVRKPMAGPLKRMLREGLGLNVEHTDGNLKQLPCPELCGKTPVKAMQTLGTEWGRNVIGEDVWLNAWKRTIQEGLVVVDDVRFPNELDAVKALGGIIVRIRRTGTAGVDAHESEVYALQFEADYEIRNEGSIAELNGKADMFVEFALKDLLAKQKL